jgi:hypothetical protein
MPNRSKPIHLHIDLDTPHILNRFYNGPARDNEANDDYCRTLLSRAADFFQSNGVKITLFVITQDLRLPNFSALLKQMRQDGHEIASHTHSHPYIKNQNSISLLKNEVRQSREEIESHFGDRPVGFRAPGFFINEEIIEVLRQEGFKYDCSLFLSPLNTAFNLYARQRGVDGVFGSPASLDKRKLADSGLLEFPTPTCLGVPFYNNLNLYLPQPFRDWIGMGGAALGLSPYLFHLIEFADYETDKMLLPPAVLRHPNIKIPLREKIRFGGKVIQHFKKRFTVELTKDCI